MNNWLFAFFMIIVATVLSLIVNLLIKGSRFLRKKREKKQPELVTVLNAEFIESNCNQNDTRNHSDTCD